MKQTSKTTRAKYRVFTLKHSKSNWANESETRSDGAEMKYQCQRFKHHPMNESYSELTANYLCKGGIRCKSEYQDRVNPHSDVMKS